MAQSVRTTTIMKEEEEPTMTVLVRQPSPRKFQIVYQNLIIFGYWHIASLYGLYLCFTSAKWQTIFFSFILFVGAEIGVTAGAHRLWAHKTYKAKLPLQILLMIMNSLAFQNSAIYWVRDHRLHHKYSDTDADPHNATRGFFYSHVGWLLVRKHPEVKKRGKELDMSDIYNNPVLRFQKNSVGASADLFGKWYQMLENTWNCPYLGAEPTAFGLAVIVLSSAFTLAHSSSGLVWSSVGNHRHWYAIPFIGTVCFGLPTLIPVYYWGETWTNAWHITMLRYVMSLNMTFLVNSAAHIWGNKPYDKKILPAQNIAVSIATCGEGFHNYHHVFPWDYRAAELGNNSLNVTTKFIDFFAWIGWAYDLKTVSKDMIKLRAQRTGDGTNLWGSEDNHDEKNERKVE